MGTRDAARRGQLRALCTHDANNVMLCYVMKKLAHLVPFLQALTGAGSDRLIGRMLERLFAGEQRVHVAAAGPGGAR